MKGNVIKSNWRKINMKKLLASMLVLVLALSVSACGSNDESNKSSKDTNKQEKKEATKKTKSDGYEKFTKLKIGMTQSEVNAILGEPTRVDKAYYYYTVSVNGKDLELEVWINTESGLVIYLSADIDEEEYRDEFVDSKTDLSGVEGLESGTINTYDACVSTFKTSGNLMNIDEDGNKQYFWINSQGGYMRVTFKADGSVKTYSGVC